MKIALTLATLLAVLICGVRANAAPSPAVEETVAYLIRYTAQSGRTFIRNGSEHSGAEAAKLMKTKYDYVKSEVHTPEDFIRLAATQSHLSGKPYLVKQADGKVVPSAEWLGEALRAYRAAHAK